MHVWNVLHAARCKYRTQKVVKKLPSVHHHTTLSGYIFATKARIDNWKKICSAAISPPHVPTMWWTYGPLAAEIGPVVWGTHPPQISTGFVSWQCYCIALQYWASAKLCGVEERTPPIFGRAAITLGIGPHSSSVIILIIITALLTYNLLGLASVTVWSWSDDQIARSTTWWRWVRHSVDYHQLRGVTAETASLYSSKCCLPHCTVKRAEGGEEEMATSAAVQQVSAADRRGQRLPCRPYHLSCRHSSLCPSLPRSLCMLSICRWTR